MPARNRVCTMPPFKGWLILYPLPLSLSLSLLSLPVFIRSSLFHRVSLSLLFFLFVTLLMVSPLKLHRPRHWRLPRAPAALPLGLRACEWPRGAAH